MKVHDYTTTPIHYERVRKRWFRLLDDACVMLHTDAGVLYVKGKKGMEWDGRSGGPFVDPLMPNMPGKDREKAIAFVHDILFHDFGICFETTNDIFRQMCLLCGYGKMRTKLLFWGVSSWIARKAFGNNTPKEEANKELMVVLWLDK